MIEKEQTGSALADLEEVKEGEETPEQYQARLAGVIQVQQEEAGVLRKKLTVTVPRAALQEELDRQYKEVLTEALIPGFRRGRAPRRLVEKRFGQEIGAQVQTKVMSNAYLAAIDKVSLNVLGDPLVWIPRRDKKSAADAGEELVDMPTAIEHLKVPDDGDYSFKCEVEVKPDFELPALEGIPIEKPELSITDPDVDKQIDRMRSLRGQWAPVFEGGVELNDMVVVDLRVTAGDEEVAAAQNVQLAARGQVIEGVAFEDFGERVKGAKPGDKRTLEGTLPDDHARESLRGKKATFEITIQDIKRLKLPELDKEFLEAQGFDSLDEYRSHVRSRLEQMLDQEVKRGLRNHMRKYLLDNTKLELPEGLSNRQTERAILRTVVDLSRRGVPEAEITKHADELRTGAREQAVRELKLYFIVEAIAEKLDIKVTEEEINAQIMEMARTYNRRFDRVRDELARNNGIESLYLEIRDEKCIDKLLESAKITEKPLNELKSRDKSGPSSRESKEDGGLGGAGASPATAAKPARKGVAESAPEAVPASGGTAKSKPARKKKDAGKLEDAT